MAGHHPNKKDYTAVAKGFHWLIALGMIATFTLGWIMTEIPGITPNKLRYYNWHKWLGVTLWVLSLLRITWRFFNPPPALPQSLAAWQRQAASFMHVMLYVATVGLPVSGYLFTLAAGFPVVYLGWIELPVLFGKSPQWIDPLKAVHYYFAYGLAIAVLAHAGAALWHHFRHGDEVLKRMLPAFMLRSSSPP